MQMPPDQLRSFSVRGLGSLGGAAATALVLVVSLFAPVATAQEADPGPTWAVRYGTDSWDFGRGVAVDRDRVYTVGNSTTYTAHDDAGQVIRRGPDDAFIARHDARGRLRWVVRLVADDAPQDTEGAIIPAGIAVAPGGDVLIAGYTRGTLPGSTRNPPEHSTDAFVARYSPAGDLRWVRQFGTDARSEGLAVAAGPDGAVYVTGQTDAPFPGSTQAEGAFLARYSSDGEQDWVKMFGTPEDPQPSTFTSWARGIAVDGDRIHVVGNIQDFNDLDTHIPFWTTFDDAGNPLVQHDLAGDGFEWLGGVAIGPSGDVHVAGTTTDGSRTVARLARYAPEPSATRWARTIANPAPGSAEIMLFVSDLEVDTDGASLLGGTSSLEDRRLTGFVARVDADGNSEWFANLDPDDGLRDVNAVDVDGSGAIYASGRTGITGSTPTHRAFLARFARDGAPGTPAIASPPPGVTRISGGDRYATAAAVADRFDPASVDTVYLATGLNFPDALAAGPAATRDGAPILLTDPQMLVEPTRVALERLGPDRVVVLGGSAAVSDAVAAEAAAAAGGATVDRVAGGDRYDTAAQLGRRVTEGVAPPFAALATGLAFPDALAGGATAADFGAPIVLTDPGALPGPSSAILTEAAPPRVIVLGGEAAVTPAVAQAGAQAAGGSTLDRVSGADRYDTAAQITDEFAAPVSEVIIATGLSFPDALAGTPLAGRLGVPLLLVDPGFIPPRVVEQLERLAPEHITILGGPGAVSLEVESQLAAFLR